MARTRSIGKVAIFATSIAALLMAGLMLTAPTASAQTVLPGGQAICANSDFAIEHAADVAVGDVFEVEGYANWFFIGTNGCGFGCHNNADFDCDGKLGNYCPIEINLRVVSGVHECMAYLNPPAADAGIGGAGDIVAVAVPAGQAGGGGSALAVTGSETGAFAAIGAGLVGFGALALGARRRVRD